MILSTLSLIKQSKNASKSRKAVLEKLCVSREQIIFRRVIDQLKNNEKTIPEKTVKQINLKFNQIFSENYPETDNIKLYFNDLVNFYEIIQDPSKVNQINSVLLTLNWQP